MLLVSPFNLAFPVPSSSIGMSKAALEAVNGSNLYGLKGAHWSSVFIDIDAHYRNRSTIDNLLPRESASKVMVNQVVVDFCFSFGFNIFSESMLYMYSFYEYSVKPL